MSDQVVSRLILASASPRRSELLAAEGYEFEVIPSPAAELHDESLAPDALCVGNAVLKAEAVFKNHTNAVVLGADTLVYLDGKPFGKPANLDEARRMLRQLSGRQHQVCSGVALFHSSGSMRFHGLAEVLFKELSEEAIESYLERVYVLDKAGSYAVQEHGERIIERIDGEFSNVMGLPVSMVNAALSELGIKPRR